MIKEYICLFIFLLTPALPCFAEYFSFQAQSSPLQMADILTVDLETGQELSQWMEQARQINPFYRVGPEVSAPARVPQSSRWIVSVYGSYATYEEKERVTIDKGDGFGFLAMYKLSSHWDLGIGYEREKGDFTSHSCGLPYMCSGYGSGHGNRKTERFMLTGRWHSPNARWYIPVGIGIANNTNDYVYYDGYWEVDGKEENESIWGFIGLGWNIPLSKKVSLGLEGRYQSLKFDFLGEKNDIQSFQAVVMLNYHI